MTRAQVLTRRRAEELAEREARAFLTRPRSAGQPHTVPRPFKLHGLQIQVRPPHSPRLGSPISLSRYHLLPVTQQSPSPWIQAWL